MPSLEDVTQTFFADTAPYIASLRAAAEAAKEFAAEAEKAGMMARMQAAAERDAAEAGLSLAATQKDIRDSSLELMLQTQLLISMDDRLAGIQHNVMDASSDLVMINQLLTNSYSHLGDTITNVMLRLGALRVAQAATARTNVGGGGQGGGIIAQWWAQWGRVVHWVVMGTLEIAATAIPAIVALGAAVAAMFPTFIHISDQMNALRAATGSWTGAMANSVAPLQRMAQAGYNLRQAVAPDAYIIFGAAINALTGHAGAFAQIAQQASNVLAGFATRMSESLSGPMGQQLVGFFANSVRFMTQWGEVLGNLGHIFVNVMGAFWGSSHVLLTVLVDITNVLVALTANPVIGWLIGFAAAMSAIYRWGRLLYDAFKWMGGSAAFTGIRAAITWVRELAAVFVILAEDIGVADAALAIFEANMAAILTVGFALIAVLAIWATVSERTKSATDNLIASINKMSPTASNLSLGIQLMTANLGSLSGHFGSLDKHVSDSYAHMGRFGTAVDQANRPLAQNATDVQKSIDEIKKLANEAVNLATGMAQAGMRTGQVGAAMNAMAISTALTDSKIQQVNQALDQYVGLLTGATSGNANFIQSMANIGTVTATTGIANLGRSTQQLSLSATQFGNALKNMGSTGASAWQNFDQVITSSAQPLMDTFRQLGVVGALSGQQVGQGALDMAVQLARFAGTGRVARSVILGFLQAQGLTFPSFAKFEQAAKHAHAGQANLNQIVAQGTIAFSHLSQMAKNAATAMNPMVAQAIDSAALKASGFNTNLSKLQTDMLNHAPQATLVADMAAVNGAYQSALTIAEKTGQGMQTSASTTASSVKQHSQVMGQSWGQAKLKQIELQQQVQNSGQSIAGSSQGVAGAVRAAMAAMSSSFDSARSHAQMLQSFIDAMHGKTITVNTNFTSTGSPGTGVPGVSNPTHGMHGMMVGLAGGGMVGGASGVDAIHAMLTAGEAVLNARAVAALGGPLSVHTLNNQPSQAVLTTGGGGGGGGAMSLDLNVNSYLSGSKVASASRQNYLIYTRRNPRNNLTLRVR